MLCVRCHFVKFDNTTLDNRQKSRKTCSSTRLPTQEHRQQIAYLVLFRPAVKIGYTLTDKKQRLTTNHLNSLSMTFLNLQVIFLKIISLWRFLSCAFISSSLRLFSVVCISFTPSILFPKNCYIGYLGHIFANLNFMGTLHFPLLNF